MICNAPQIDRYVNGIGNMFRNPCVVSESLMERVNKLFEVCGELRFNSIRFDPDKLVLPSEDLVLTSEDLEIIKSDFKDFLYKELWIRVPRGTFGDYKASQVKPRDAGKRSHAGQKYWVQNEDANERDWTLTYPDETVWYKLALIETNEYRIVELNGKTVSCVFSSLHEIEPEFDAIILCDYLIDLAKESMELIRSGTYKEIIESELPYRYRCGLVEAKHVGSVECVSEYIAIIPCYIPLNTLFYPQMTENHGWTGDFMHVDEEDLEMFGDKIEWEPLWQQL